MDFPSDLLCDSSASDGLERCLAAVEVLWATQDVSLYMRNPAKGTLVVFQLLEGELHKSDRALQAGQNVRSLLSNSTRADNYHDHQRGYFYLRQKRSGQPNAVLRIKCTKPQVNNENTNVTKAILMAASAHFESYRYVSQIKEPQISEGLRKDLIDYLRPICESISERSFLPLVGFVNITVGDEHELVHCRYYSGDKILSLRTGNPYVLSIIENIEKLRFQNDLQKVFLGSINNRLEREDRIQGISDILVFKKKTNTFRGAVFFGVPTGYSITDLDRGLMTLMLDQFVNYGLVYKVFNEERFSLIRQQQEFGIEYAVDFTQAARHEARDNLTIISDNAEFLKQEALEEGLENEDVEDAYEEIKKSIADIDIAYSTIQSLADEEIQPEVIGLKDLFSDLFSTFHSQFEELNIKFENDIEDEKVRVHYQQVRVAFFNMIQNSCAAFLKNRIPKKQRKISVSLGGKKRRPLLYEDTAGGIRKLTDKKGEKMSDIQMSWRKGVSGTGGTGFGMHLIRRYLDANGCLIELQETKHGVKFVIDVFKVMER